MLLGKMEACGNPGCTSCYPLPRNTKGRPEFIPLIEGVLEVMDQDHWVQGTLHGEKWDEDGRTFVKTHCLLGFTEVALMNMGFIHNMETPLDGIVAGSIPNLILEFRDFAECQSRSKNGLTVAAFNDKKTTTYEDVRLFVKSLIGECE